MSKAPATITMSMLWQKLENIERELNRKLKKIEERELKTSIEECSLHKAKKLLHMSEGTLLDEVKAGNLRAMKYTRNGVTRYRFRLSDIYDFQKARAEMVEEEFTMQAETPFDPREYVKQFHLKNKGRIA